MEHELTIQQVSEITGLNVHTLRYYEKIGLLDPIGRTASGYRYYTQSDLAWIQFLNRLRATGMPIRKMQEFTDLRRRGKHTLPKRRLMLESHYQEVLEHMAELRGNLAAIEKKINYFRELEEQENLKGEDCHD